MDKPTIIVTGASQGLGAAIACLAAANQARVVLAARRTSELERQVRRIEQQGGTALAVTGDVSRYEDCQRIINQAVQAFGRIDTVVNNAAIIEPLVSLAESKLEDWSRLIAIDLMGTVMISKLAIPYLRKTHGRVINLTSGAAKIAIPEASAYCTAKAAVNQFSKVLAVEEPDLTVMLFMPGEVDTAMQAEIRERAKGKAPNPIYQYLIDQYEQGQLLQPEKPALAAVGLALHAPRDWSGETLIWDEQRVQKLCQENLLHYSD